MLKLSPRLERLKNRLYHKDYWQENPWYFADVNILEQNGYEHLSSEPIPIRKAYALQYVAENLPIKIYDDELIVGNPNQNSVEFGMSVPKYLTNQERKFLAGNGLSEQSLFGHHPPCWSSLLRLGVLGLAQEIKQHIHREKRSSHPDEDRLIEWQAMLVSLDALEIYAKRCAAEAARLENIVTDKERKQELRRMKETCLRVPYHPAQSLQEALQSYWILYTVMNSGGEFLPLGRIDQYFGVFYERDIASGKLTEMDATDLLGSFLVKCNEKNVLDAKLMHDHREIGFLSPTVWYVSPEQQQEFRKVNQEHYWHDDEAEDSEHNKFYGQETNNRMMTCVVGGVDEQGHDATNAATYRLIELVQAMKLLMPTMGVRIHRDTPERLLRLVADVLRYGQGEPIIYNDEAIIPEYERIGIPAADARGYSSDGCWETVFPGQSNFVYSFIFVLQCLEWTLNRGIGFKSGRKDGVDVGSLESFSDFACLYEAFLQQVNFYMEAQWAEMVRSLGLTGIAAPDPLFSALSASCREQGRDYYRQGAKYQLRMLLCTGFADTIDSLYTIRELVYVQHRLTLGELVQAMKDNWRGHERLRAYIINRLPKYGNDAAGPDELAVRFLRDYSSKIRELRGRNEKIILTGGIGTFHVYAALGDMTGASANGRWAYDALAPNYSPVPGSDQKGPLCVIKSATKADLSELMAGTPIDIAINANEFQGDSGIGRLRDLILDFCDVGGQIMTITSSSVEELKDAKCHPEKHRGLRVRMGGLSAYFIQLAPEQQDKIIARFR